MRMQQTRKEDKRLAAFDCSAIILLSIRWARHEGKHRKGPQKRRSESLHFAWSIADQSMRWLRKNERSVTPPESSLLEPAYDVILAWAFSIHKVSLNQDEADPKISEERPLGFFLYLFSFILNQESFINNSYRSRTNLSAWQFVWHICSLTAGIFIVCKLSLWNISNVHVTWKNKNSENNIILVRIQQENPCSHFIAFENVIIRLSVEL